jgi:hypothetical protein
MFAFLRALAGAAVLSQKTRAVRGAFALATFSKN